MLSRHVATILAGLNAFKVEVVKTINTVLFTSLIKMESRFAQFFYNKTLHTPRWAAETCNVNALIWLWYHGEGFMQDPSINELAYIACKNGDDHTLTFLKNKELISSNTVNHFIKTQKYGAVEWLYSNGFKCTDLDTIGLTVERDHLYIMKMLHEYGHTFKNDTISSEKVSMKYPDTVKWLASVGFTFSTKDFSKAIINGVKEIASFVQDQGNFQMLVEHLDLAVKSDNLEMVKYVTAKVPVVKKESLLKLYNLSSEMNNYDILKVIHDCYNEKISLSDTEVNEMINRAAYWNCIRIVRFWTEYRMYKS